VELPVIISKEYMLHDYKEDEKATRVLRYIAFLISVSRGETAFYQMQIPIGWAKRPMIRRIAPPNLSSSVPLTFVYGARSWMDSSTGERVQELRPHSYVQVHYVRRAGHHVHADQPEAFNSVVREVCCLVDRNEDTQPCPHSIPDFGNGI
jgi:pimeloyl-ACP methyl ester carboxylesterase